MRTALDALTLTTALLLVPMRICLWQAAANEGGYELVQPPKTWNLAPFYKQCVFVGDFPVLGSARVSPFALKEAAWIISRILDARPDVLQALVEARVRCVVMAWNERTTDVPEHSDLKPRLFWNRRARGLGATRARPVVSCGEENLLGYPGDPYRGENILIHEFAHTIHQMALMRLDRGFGERLNAAYRGARRKKRWQGTYAATNPGEYWAEGVQCYFDANRSNDRQHNHVDTREKLAEYDPELFGLIDRTFRGIRWRYRPIWERPARDRKHLAGYDPSKAPTFRWSPEEEAEARRVGRDRKQTP